MPEPIIARNDPALSARITRELAMEYAEGPSQIDDRPPHVRAASGIVNFREYLVVIQDDANWLALVDDADRIHALPLPASPHSGARVFSPSRGNKHEKFDLEACIVVPGPHGPELIGFGSGSHPGREWLLRVHESDGMDAVLCDRAAHAQLELDVTAEFFDVRRFYDALRANAEFVGAGLNLEGAVYLGRDTIRIFQRGNAPSNAGAEGVDATAELSWRALSAHLTDPANVPPPTLSNIRRYQLGTIDGVRLTFSDAEQMGDGRILYSASAEDPAGDRIVGSAIGIIEKNGQARWTELEDHQGGRFEGKIEGLSLHRRSRGIARFVIDDDDEEVPSKLYEARLNSAFLGGN